MPTTNKPTPVATGTDPGLYNPVTGPVGPLDRAPDPVPPGPGLGVTATIPTTIPVVTAQTETVDVAAATGSSFVPDTVSTNTVVKYLSVSDESVAVNGQVTNINFVGTGVSVANNANALNSVVVTIGGGATYGNSNVVSLLAGFGSNTLNTTGNVTGGNLVTSAQVVASGVIQSGTGLSTGGYLSVDGSTDLHNTIVNGTLSVTGNLTVTGTTSTVNTEVVNVSESVVGNIDAGNLRTAGQVSAAGNITGNFFIGNGSALSSLTGGNVSGAVANATYALTSNAATYSTQATTADTANAVAGANVSGTVANATYATSAGSATTATTAGTANAVAGANVSGTVANATYALNSNAATYSTQATYADTANAVAGANVSGTVANATYATSAGSATTANTVTDGAQANITSVGILTSLSVSGNITTTANVAANYVVLSGGLVGSGASPAPSISGFSTISAVGNITGGNLLTVGLISASGNVTGNYILGNGSQLTSLPAPTVAQDITSVGAMSIMTYDGNLKYASYATVEPVSGNITAGNISTTGNIIAGNLDAVNLVINNISSDDSTLVSVQDGLQVYGDIIADNFIGNGNQLTGLNALSYARPASGTAIDLTKQLATLDAGSYTLADGAEGQILYLALRSGAKNSVTVTFANVRINSDGSISSNLTINVFNPATAGLEASAVFCIFTNGAWSISNGDV